MCESGLVQTLVLGPTGPCGVVGCISSHPRQAVVSVAAVPPMDTRGAGVKGVSPLLWQQSQSLLSMLSLFLESVLMQPFLYAVPCWVIF